MTTIKHLGIWMATIFMACGNSGTTSDTTAVADSSATVPAEGARTALPLDKVKLPPGFTISVFAEVDNARSLAISPSGTVYVGNRNADKVYAVKDTDGDHVADKKWVVASGLKMPNGVAFRDGDLYIAEISRITKLPGIESRLDNPPAPVVVNDKFPKDEHHGWKYIAFGPDGNCMCR